MAIYALCFNDKARVNAHHWKSTQNLYYSKNRSKKECLYCSKNINKIHIFTVQRTKTIEIEMNSGIVRWQWGVHWNFSVSAFRQAIWYSGNYSWTRGGGGCLTRLYLLHRIELTAWRLRHPIWRMPTWPRIFYTAAHESRFVRGPHNKMSLCRILAWWKVRYIPTLFIVPQQQ